MAYISISTVLQAERGGDRDAVCIPAQRDANRTHAHGLGALVAAEFVDRGYSRRSTDRPEVQQMLPYILEHSVDYVIVHKFDRLAQSRADDVSITQAIHVAGTRLISSTEGIDTTPNGVLSHGIMASIEEFYSRNLAQEVIKGMRQKAIQGATPGRAPVGYLDVRRQTEDGREYRAIQLDRERAPHIALAFDTYASGEWSVAQLATALTERGLRTRATASRSPATLTGASPHRALTNSSYKGIVTLNGAQYAGSLEPLVPTKIWDIVQRVLASRRQGGCSRIHTH